MTEARNDVVLPRQLWPILICILDFQRVARENLNIMMEFEADRMTNLLLEESDIAPERDVVLEERRMHVETNPSVQLLEAMEASLFVHHPYGIPTIGWGARDRDAQSR
ncbi:hypothetical protein SAMN05216228_106017 [Rhizobium tibeticum]|uniref:Peptidase M16 N-terminal domain-containing protein n=1 Tax=Rhizobium tibeticum TaxID=501024 RepID=A0A1H8WBG6_9HYPH|nr:hypothetical protein RTCCBAU85039_6530 [Rhizobium tibeticum]SEP24976.1 hypothetical protein SAMN05216228_106017 [Rhizobium tibeticum]